MAFLQSIYIARWKPGTFFNVECNLLIMYFSLELPSLFSTGRTLDLVAFPSAYIVIYVGLPLLD
jgi:hypothetical protein